jgi:hypothetical protein
MKAAFVFTLIVWISFASYFGSAGYTKLKIDELNDMGKSANQSETVSLGRLTFKNSYFMEAYQEEQKAIQ